MAFEVDDKTEQPTERRRRLAREQGLGPRSADLTLACRLLGVAAGLQFFGARLVQDASRFLVESLQRTPGSQLTVSDVTSQGWDAFLQFGVSAFGCCACVLVAGLAAQGFQVGWRFQTAELLPDVSRLSPARGFSKIWRVENATQATLALLKYLAILGLGGWSLWSNLGRLSALMEQDVATTGQFVGEYAVLLAWQLAAAFLVVGLADYGFQAWKFEQSLRMSPAEIREEARLQSGDPQWKQRRGDIWRSHSAPSKSP